jgi:hypothetical protein
MGMGDVDYRGNSTSPLKHRSSCVMYELGCMLFEVVCMVIVGC